MSRAVPNKRKLTTIFLQKLKPQASAFMVWDAMQRGLALRVEPTGYKAWKLVYRYHGRPRWYHLAATDAIGLADARRIAAELMLRVIKGEDPAAEKRAERVAGTFAELAQKYLEQYAKKRNKSWKQSDALIRRHVLPHWGKLEANSITRADVKTLMRGMEQAPIAANQMLAAVSAVFTWAVKEEIVSGNPCRGVARNPTGAICLGNSNGVVCLR